MFNMPLRDYFAAAALTADFITGSSPSSVARQAYIIADAMMVERDRPKLEAETQKDLYDTN